jgi:hypothetical protein
MASSPGDKSPGYHRTPLTGLNNLDAKTKPDNAGIMHNVSII